MLLDGLDADAEFGCGFLVRLAFGDQLQHFHFARSQFDDFLFGRSRAVERLRIEPVATPGNRGTEKSISLFDFPDRRANIVGRDLFEQKSHCTGIVGVLDVGVITVRREHEHLGGGEGFEQLAGGCQTIEQRHRDVHQDHVGTKLSGQRDRLPSVLRFAHHFKILFEFEHFAKSLAHNHVVFRQ